MLKDWRGSKGAFAALLGPPAGFLLVFFLIPLGIVWLYSFGQVTSLTDIVVDGSPENYARAFSPLYLGVLWKSAWIAGLTTLACLVAGFPVALAIAFAGPRAKAWLLVLVMLPFWTNLLIRTYALIAVLREEGYVNLAFKGAWSLLAAAGLTARPIEPLRLLHDNFAVVVGLVYVQLPFMVLPIYAALERMDRSLLEASLDLGAGPWRTIWAIAVPLALPGIASGLLITFIPSLGAFLTPDLLGGPSSQMIANVIERQFKRANDWPFGAALSFVLMYLTLLLVAGQAAAQRLRGRR
jgi:spermidine/putrescine transport system permease protein